MMAEFLRDVRCRGCHRQLGVAKVDHVIFCDGDCASDYPAAATEARDALLEAVYLDSIARGTRYTNMQLGEMFGITRQRAHQILRDRNIRRTP